MATKTENPSQAKREEARQRGRVARSFEFTGAAVLLAAGLVMLLTFDTMSALLRDMMHDSVSVAFGGGDRSPTAQLRVGLELGARVAGPVLAAAFVTAAVVAYLQVGWKFTVRSLIPDSSRMSPALGWKRLMNPDRLVELTKSLVRLAVMFLVAAAIYESTIATIVGLPRASVDTSSGFIRGVVLDQATFLLLSLVVFAVIDLAWQRHRFHRELMMTRDEVTEERRQTEGDPQVRAEQKRRHRLLTRDVRRE